MMDFCVFEFTYMLTAYKLILFYEAECIFHIGPSGEDVFFAVFFFAAFFFFFFAGFFAAFFAFFFVAITASIKS